MRVEHDGAGQSFQPDELLLPYASPLFPYTTLFRSHRERDRRPRPIRRGAERRERAQRRQLLRIPDADRKSTRLNSSHMSISYAVFCLKKKKRPASTRKARSEEHTTELQSPRDIVCR